MRRLIERLGPSLAFLLLAAYGAPLHAQDAGQWGFYSGEHGTRRATRRSRRSTSRTSARLRVAWRHKQVDPAILAANPDFTLSNRYMVTPIYVDGMLYVPNGFGLAEAIDPKTGRTLWTQKPLIDGPEGLPSLMISKGVAYWGRGDDARILTVRQQHLFALEPEDRCSRSRASATAARSISRRKSSATSGTACPSSRGDVVVVGSSMLEQDSAVYKDGPPGYVRAFDVRTGKQRWTLQRRCRARAIPATATWQDEAWQLQRRRQHLVDVQRRRRARARLRADVGRHERHVRRPPPRRQPLRQLDRRARTRRPASASGTSKPCTTICSTTTCPPRRS